MKFLFMTPCKTTLSGDGPFRVYWRRKEPQQQKCGTTSGSTAASSALSRRGCPLHVTLNSQWPLALLVICGSILSGCQPESSETANVESAPQDIRQPLQTTLTRLKQLNDEITQAAARDDLESAHDQLHETGTILESLESLCESPAMAPEQKSRASRAIETLFESFGEVDARLHGQEGKLYSEVSESIDDALGKLSEVIENL